MTDLDSKAIFRKALRRAHKLSTHKNVDVIHLKTSPEIDIAAVELASEIIQISLNHAFYVRLKALQIRVHETTLPTGRLCTNNCDRNIFTLHDSLTWLFLHELHHAVLGHFDLAHGTPSFHLVSRANRKDVQLEDISKQMYHKVAPCYELQADHDAIELVLDSYSIEYWNDIRATIASIAAVMVLIEKHDPENNIEQSSHPKAATRIFQLLGHVTEMWSLPSHAKAKARGETTIREDELPSDEEKQAFSKEVILPSFWDAVALAEVAEAKSIISDLGSPEDFFADVARAKLGQWDELVTVGAREWAELKDANDLILPLLPINQETN